MSEMDASASSPPVVEVAEPTARLKWHKGTLLQQWIIRTVTDGDGSWGTVIGARTEWLEVPTNDED